MKAIKVSKTTCVLIFILGFSLETRAELNAPLGAKNEGRKGKGIFVASFIGAESEVERLRVGQTAIDGQNNIYVVGRTKSADFPATRGVLGEKWNGGSDIFIAKFDPQIRTLIAATFVGGSGDENEGAITLDDKGNVYVGGTTTSKDFPKSGKSFSPGLRETATRTFIVKISGDLSRLLAAAVLSGETDPRAGPMRVLFDSKNRRIVIGGNTTATDFPVTERAYQRKYAGGRTDEFVTIMNPELSEIIASTYLGGSDYDSMYRSLAIDEAGNIFVGGNTWSKDFPTTGNAFKKESSGGTFTGHVSKFNSDLSELSASTFIGAKGDNFVYSMDLDRHGHAVFAGHVDDSMPTTAGAYKRTNNGFSDVSNVGMLSNDLSTLLASTFIASGGEGSDAGGFSWCSNVMADQQGNILVLGQVGPPARFPTTAGALDETLNGGEDVFVAKFDHGLTRLVAATFLGGSGTDRGGSIQMDRAGNIVIAGSTTSADFPVSLDAYDHSFDRSQDVWVAKLGSDLAETQTSAVHQAVKSGDIRTLRRLLKDRPLLINDKDRYGRTPLDWAARFGQVEILDHLLKAKADRNAGDESENTPLHLAALHEHYKAVEMLLKGKADPNRQNRDGNTPLHLAANAGHGEILSLLGAGKADLEIQNKDGNTALHRAAWSRQKEATEALLRCRANVNAKNKEGNTPLHLATVVIYNHEVIALLTKNGASLNERNNRGQTPLHLAAGFPVQTNGLELLKADPDVNSRDSDGRLPLHYAAARGRVNIVKELLRRNVDAAVRDKSGKTALDLATEAKQASVVEILKY
jgi:ankyrin repeat protein